MADAVRFIRKNGRVIPISAAAGAGARVARGAAVGAGAALAAKSHFQKQEGKPGPKIKINRALDLTGLGLSVASGALAAATFSGGAKGFLAGHAAAHGIDIVGVGANVASVAGKGHGKERAAQAAKQEARNFAVGNAVYLGGILASAKNREAAVQYTAKGVQMAKKILDFSKKALRVV